MPRLSARKPNQSKLSLRFAGVSSMMVERPSTVRMPKGRLTKNTQRQEKLSVSQPPSVGPMIGPSMTPMPQMAMAWPRCSNG